MNFQPNYDSSYKPKGCVFAFEVATMHKVGLDLLGHLRKLGRPNICISSGSQTSYRHDNSFPRCFYSFFRAGATLPRPSQGHITTNFTGEMTTNGSSFSIIRRFITERVGSLKETRGGGDPFIRRFVPSNYSRLSSLRRSYGSSIFSSHEGIVWSLIGINVAVYFLWKHADRRFMEKNFKISVDGFLNGRVHTLITSAFSHIKLDHLFSNMIGLYFFGSAIGQIFGAEYLLKLYLAGALGGSIVFLVHEALIVPWLEGIPRKYYNARNTPGGLGASGAVNAIILLDIFLFPKAVHYINFFIPVPAILLGALIIGQDLWRVKQGDTQISGAVHLGGALVATLAWMRIKRPWV